jgi:hypothetical protein
MTDRNNPVYALGKADGISSVLIKQRMDGLAHRRPVDRADDDGVRSVAVSLLHGTEHARLCVGNKRYAAVIHLPIAAREAVFNTFLAEGSRQLVLVGMQNIDAKPAGVEQTDYANWLID